MLTITAIIPNYNYASFLPARMASIRAQSRQADALVFLDDGSTDGSLDVAKELLGGWDMPIRFVPRDVNSGSVLGQWEAGLREAATDAVWIAEADDEAEPGLLKALAARLEEDPEAAFAFADSAVIDEEGKVITADSKAYTTAFDGALATDQRLPAEDFIRRCLTPRNAMVNVSAVLFRVGPLRAAFERLGAEARRWRCAGDWRLYLEVCAGGGNVHYVARPLNRHRHHARSVTGGARAADHYTEIVALLLRLRRHLGPDPARDAAMARHLRELAGAWSLGDAA